MIVGNPWVITGKIEGGRLTDLQPFWQQVADVLDSSVKQFWIGRIAGRHLVNSPPIPAGADQSPA